MWCCYDVVSFLQNPHKRHLIARPLGWGIGCILCIQKLICILPHSLQFYMQFYVILDCIIMAPDYILFGHALIWEIENYAMS